MKAASPKNGVFRRESDMANAARRWMESRGLSVKSEFVTPWGICDLVGIRFNQKNVAHRLRLRQTAAIGSITRARLLLEIPDIDSDNATTALQLAHQHSKTLSERDVQKEIDRLISGRFVIRSADGYLQKVNGWVPLQNRLVAVELKLSRIEEALWQARSNLKFANESYVAFPAGVAGRIRLHAARWDEFFESGIGLLAIKPQSCRVLIQAKIRSSIKGKVIQMYCVEKFWRTRLKGN